MSPQGFFCLMLTIFGVFENIRAQCPAGECEANGYLDPDLTLSPDKNCFTNGESVSLACAGDLGGPPSNQCNNGNWVLPPSTCEVFTCPKPTLGDALNVVPDEETYIARDTITYTCNQGYTLTGTAAATCDAQDTWNPATVPVCIASCAAPSIRNGNLTTDGPFNSDDSAQINCFEGSDLESGASSTITCQSDGTWDEVPQCFSRCTVPGVPNSNYENEDSINHDSSRTINCVNGYSYEQTTSFTVSCTDGVLSDAVPEKCYEDCILPPAPQYGDVSGGSLHGESIEFVCDRGYGTNATYTTDTCTNGTWDNGGATPTCYGLSLEDSITLYCNPDKFIVEIPGGILGDDVSVDSVTLGTCPQGSYYDGQYLYVNSSYTECDTQAEVDVLTSQIVYTNTVRSAVTTEEITTQESLTINVVCAFDQNNIVSSSAIVQNSVSKTLDGTGQFEMVFGAYTDVGYNTEITGDDKVNSNDDIYLRAEVIYVSMIDVFPTRCYATPESDPSYYRYSLLIEEGCPTSTYVSDLKTDASTNQNFAFHMNAFRFTESASDSIYIHCELKICPADELHECPLPASCPGVTRRRRATHISFSRHVSAGPIRISGADTADKGSSGAWESTALSVYSATVSLVLLCVVVIVGVIAYRRRNVASGAGYGRTGQI